MDHSSSDTESTSAGMRASATPELDRELFGSRPSHGTRDKAFSMVYVLYIPGTAAVISSLGASETKITI